MIHCIYSWKRQDRGKGSLSHGRGVDQMASMDIHIDTV